ncbi:MAG: beta-galactosidase [Candidatus Aminicenantes bacterium]|nr:beta-galactosidase [Candidatus Aminicenantes bacterium]
MKRTIAVLLMVLIWPAAGLRGTGPRPDGRPFQMLPGGRPLPPEPWPKAIHTFGFRGTEFALDGKPFQMLAGEMHFQRIPREYWKDRLLKARAMGLNTVCTYVFWNLLEAEPGKWDFSGGNDLAAFIRTAGEAGLWVVVRPGPYACAEWDFGGLPIWLLRTPDIKVRCLDPRYIEACRRYIAKLADLLRPLQVHKGGPVLMVQIENEYGSYGNDRGYLSALKSMWEKGRIEVPFYTADGATPYMLEAGSIPGCAIGLDPGANEKDFAAAAKLGRGVPVFCSELYPGWLTHWGEPWARAKTEEVLKDLEWLLANKKSFNLYVVHGGTNWGFWAGANMGDAYQPDVTSYDYDAPLDEMGRPTPKYFAIRDLLAKHQPDGAVLPDMPAPLPVIEIATVAFTEGASLFDNLPPSVAIPQPKPMEFLGQDHGFILYRTGFRGHASGKLKIWELHDYANIYVDGQILGTLSRAKKEDTIEIPAAGSKPTTLDILVEGMGRINFSQYMIDRKGITDRVTLSGMTLMDWQAFSLPMEPAYLAGLKFKPLLPGPQGAEARPGMFFRGSFDLETLGDTYLDMRGWAKGIVWINGHNLGRYWEIGPQKRLYCPAPFLKKGRNEIVVFDLHRTAPAIVTGEKSLD